MKKEILEVVRRRNLTEIVHFTRNRGLTGILHTRTVKSRDQLPEDERLEYVFEPNADIRRDTDWLNYVNLSVSEINEPYFSVSSERWHAGEDRWWCILCFSPEILAHEGVYFSTTNNMYTSAQRGTGVAGLENLFLPRIKQYSERYVDRPTDLPPHIATCEQAEVLYPRALSTDFLSKVYVRTDRDADDVAAQISATGHSAVDIVVKLAKFQGYRGAE